MFHYVSGVLEEKPYHMLGTSIIVGRLYWPNSSLADLKETKIPPHPCSSFLGFMYLYVHM